MAQVGFDGFVILWPKPNPNHYKINKNKNKIVTQPSPKNRPNPTHQALKTDPTRQVGLGQVELAGFLQTPTSGRLGPPGPKKKKKALPPLVFSLGLPLAFSLAPLTSMA